MNEYKIKSQIKEWSKCMNILKAIDYNHASRLAANLIAAQVIVKPDCVLGLATGSTPIGTYEQLIKYYEKGDLDFTNVTSINLDEYVGLSPEDDQSYRYFMNHHLFNHINISKEKTFVPNGLELDPIKACNDYNNIIHSSNGVDLQLLGLGLNGHIGFNEPSDSFKTETHCVSLTQSTIDANARFFDTIDMVPQMAYTMGIKSIMQAKRIVVLVSGNNKADIVKQAFFGPVTPLVPASILQFHKDVILIGDREALSKI